MTKVALYGFGRIGRQFLKAALEKDLFIPSAIADIHDPETLAALFSVDSNYGRCKETVSAGNNLLFIGQYCIPYVKTGGHVPDWGSLGIEIIVDCTGNATNRAGAQLHLDRGAKYVIVSAPSKSLADCDAVLLKGINLQDFNPHIHKIISTGSCTTNALAAPIKVLLENFGIRYGLFSTVHSYTNSQSLTDQPKNERRDSWAATENIIPSSSGAAKALQFIWNDLKVTGKAYRVPTRTGSIAELTLLTESECSATDVINAFRKAANGELHGIMDVLEEEWPSSRIIGDPHSALIDIPLIIRNGDLLSVAVWYDNEWGFSHRLAEVTHHIIDRLENHSN